MNYLKKSMHYDWSDVLCHAHTLNSFNKMSKETRHDWSDVLCHAHPVWVLSLSNLKDSLELALPKLNCAVSFRRNTISL